jgi:NAD(P)-dependent dehydrogenase (short-subunit alcohol dehydrogenase family)
MIASRVRRRCSEPPDKCWRRGTLDIDDRGLVCLANGNVGLDMPYCSAKHAVVGLTRQLAHELGPFGITVNSVAPGFVRSNPASERQWAGYGGEGQKALVERIAMKRLGTARDIANSVVFFASELAGFVNGQVLAVDGGK